MAETNTTQQSPKKSKKFISALISILIIVAVRYGVSTVIQIANGSYNSIDLSNYSCASTSADVLGDNGSYPCLTLNPEIYSVTSFTLTAKKASIDGTWNVYINDDITWKKVGTMTVKDGKGSTSISLNSASTLHHFTILPEKSFFGMYSFELEIKNIKR